MKELIVTVGLPRSGKSTWCLSQGFPIVNRDSIRLAMTGITYLQEVEPYITLLEDNMVKSLFLAGHHKVIVDATNITGKRRERWISEKWDTSYKCFKTSVDICILRAEDTLRPDLIPVIRRMNEALTFPRINIYRNY